MGTGIGRGAISKSRVLSAQYSSYPGVRGIRSGARRVPLLVSIWLFVSVPLTALVSVCFVPLEMFPGGAGKETESGNHVMKDS